MTKFLVNKVMKLSWKYRIENQMKQSDAMKKAWQEIKEEHKKLTEVKKNEKLN